MADDGCRSSVVHHYSRAVGGAGAGGRVMAAANTTPLASGLRNGDDGLEQHKGPVGWTARAFDSTHRSSAGESGRRVISRHLTRRRFHAYRLGLSRMVELRRARNDLNRLAQIRRRRNRRACDRPEGSWSLEWTLLKSWASHGRALINATAVESSAAPPHRVCRRRCRRNPIRCPTAAHVRAKLITISTRSECV